MNGCTCGATLKHSADCVIFWEPLPRKMVLGDIMRPVAVHDSRGTRIVYGRYPTNWGFKLDTDWPFEYVQGHQ